MCIRDSLRNAVAEHQSRFYGLSYDPDTEVLITAGATEAIAGAVLGLCDHGDEVITFEPTYDSYSATIKLAGAVEAPVLLSPPDWSFDRAAFEAALTSQTRAILLNSPHNPTGKVFTNEELAWISERAIEHDLVVISDDVYQHMVSTGVISRSQPSRVCANARSALGRPERAFHSPVGRSVGSPLRKNCVTP